MAWPEERGDPTQAHPELKCATPKDGACSGPLVVIDGMDIALLTRAVARHLEPFSDPG